jgi:PAS domain S-box-containing protein
VVTGTLMAKVNILLVDDKPANLQTLEAVLDPLGENLVRALSGAEALRRMLEEDYAVVLLDVQMPGLSGFDVARLIRGRDRTRHTPIIFMTAFESEQFPVLEAYQLGAVDYLVKPLVPEVVRAKVAGFVELFQKSEQIKQQAEQLRLLERREFERRLAEEKQQRELDRLRVEAAKEKELAAVLREQREWFRVTLASIGDAVITTDPDGRVTFLNPIAEALTGWRHDPALGRPLDEVFPIVDETTRQPIANPVARVLARGAVVGLGNHTLLRRQDGTETPIDDSAAPIRDADGKVAGVVLIFRDVTERRRVERERAQLLDREQAARAEAEQQRDFVRLVLEHTPIAVAVTEGPGHRLAFLNQAAAAVLGLDPRQVVGKLPGEIAPETAREVVPVLERVMQTGQPEMNPELTVRIPGGRTVYVQVTYAPLPGPQGRPRGVVLLGVDLTRRHQAEQDRERVLRRLEILARANRQLNAVLEAPVVLRTLVRAAMELAEATAGTAGLLHQGRMVFNEYHQQGGVLPTAVALGPGQGVPGWVMQYRTPYLSDDAANDPQVLPELQQRFAFTTLVNMPILNHGGQLLGCFELHNKAGGRPFDADDVVMLQGLAAAAAIALENAQLLQRVREADQRKDEFLAMLAHELRNPLAPVRNGLHILRHVGTASPAGGPTLDMMDRQVQHLTRLVDDLLDVSRITRGKVSLRQERLDLGRLVRDTVEDRRRAFEQAGLALTPETPETPVWVAGDATRLAQVFGNLLDNALKFTERGGAVAVRLAVDEPARQARVSVRDTGMGIDPDMLPRLFGVFAQSDRSLDRSRGGLGLGLAVVKGLVELHGGEVSAASAGAGKGAEFSVALPLEPEPAALANGTTPKPAPAVEPLRVVVVEDNHDAADSLRLLLELRGHHVAVAYSGPEGVDKVLAERPDVVVCDIGLPGFDGYEVARRLRQLPGLEKTVLVALTGYGQDEDRRRSQEAGFDQHLVKPADPAELERVLTTHA